jgi:hypothetical protein|tara:strand:+ start:1971 stop:2345 length:375 start_codon:yes stop_codon:yes gene_type:complete
MSKKETRIYKNGWKPDAAEAAKKFGFVKSDDIVYKKRAPSTIDQIMTGWGNLVKSHFVDLEPELKKESERRLKICDGCDMRSGGTCSTNKETAHLKTGVMTRGCGCRLAAKALSPESECPVGKW